MLIHLLAQTTASSQMTESDWTKIIAICTVIGLIQTVGQPALAWVFRNVVNRITGIQNRGDRVSLRHAMEIKGLADKLDDMKGEFSNLRNEIKAAEKERHEERVAETAELGELAAKLEREFVRKAELNQLRQDMNDQHRQLMDRLDDFLQRGRK